jgi:predicted RND superfamily exporter protein
MRGAALTSPTPLSRRFVEWTLRHGRILWIVAMLLAVPALVRTAWLYAHLRSDLEELLPPDAESVVALKELRQRMPGLQYLGVVVEAQDTKGAERLLDELAARVRAYPPELVHSVRTGVSDEQKFVEDHAPLYADLADLQSVHDRIAARKEYESAKAFGADIDDEDAEPPPPLDFTDIEKKYHESDDAKRFPDGRFTDPNAHVSLMLIEVGAFSTGSEAGHALLDRVKADLAQLDPQKFAPGARVGFTGDVAINVEELSALVTDLTTSTLLVFVAVSAVILIFYRWWRSMIALIGPLLVATVLAFALVTLPPFRITELNSNTAFLGSIIIGNGINFGIILLARYLEERRNGVVQREALVTAVWGSRIGTLSAALAAGLSYASLVITHFRGFRQFGVIGGIGMVLCWVGAYALMPPLLAWLDRGEKAAPKPRSAGAGIMARLARGVEKAPVPVIVVTVILTALAAFSMRRLDRSAIETDFSQLRRADTFVSGEGFWGKKMDALLGRYLTPLAVLADDADQARKMAAAIEEARARPPLHDVVASVTTIDQVLPRDQEKKIALTEEIRGMLTPKIRSLVPPDKMDQVDKMLGKGPLVPITPDDLPPSFTTGMRERDGRLDRTVLVYPKPVKALWESDAIVAIARTLRDLAKSVDANHPPRIAGSLPVSADIISSIEHDGPLATAIALGGVMALVLLLLRRSLSTAFVIGSLILGVSWLTGAILALHVKINFANFIAFPITFGIGVDYSVNVMARYVADGERDITSAVASTGGAVGLCSMTTIIGYSSLLLAENRALFSFGLVAVLGEIACLTTAVVVVPAIVLVIRRGRRTEASSQA